MYNNALAGTRSELIEHFKQLGVDQPDTNIFTFGDETIEFQLDYMKRVGVVSNEFSDALEELHGSISLGGITYMDKSVDKNYYFGMSYVKTVWVIIYDK